jgi:hypothetical protein
MRVSVQPTFAQEGKMLKKLWLKVLQGGQNDSQDKSSLPRPKEILQPVGQLLVTKYKQDPDWVWNLLVVTRPSADDPGKTELRVFSSQEAAGGGVNVRDWHSLDGHQELIHYLGWLDKKTREMELTPGPAGLRRAG